MSRSVLDQSLPGITGLESTWRDVRHGLRRLRRHPGFAAAVVLVLGLGIAASTAMFSVAYAVLIRDLPFAHPDRLVGLASSGTLQRPMAGAADYYDWRARQTVFTDLALTRPVGSFNLTGAGEPERLAGARVTASLCTTLGVTPAIGRCFTDAEERDPARAAGVVLLSDALWRRRFAADPAIVGRTIQLNGRALEVVGVMGPAFRYPSREVEVWAPLHIPPDALALRRDYSYLCAARLKPGVSLGQAQAQMTAIDAQIAREHAVPDHPNLIVEPLLSRLVAGVGGTLWLLCGIVGVLFAITLVSLGNLIVVDATGRAGELAVRTTLGASRGRLARQRLVELVPLAILGGLAGVGGARVLLVTLVPMLPVSLPRVEEIGLHGPVLALAAGLATAALLVLGIGSIWTVRSDLRRGPRAWARLRDGLVLTQVAGTAVLLVAAALLADSFARVRATDPGLDGAGVLSLQLAVDRGAHGGSDESLNAYLERLIARVREVPGVTAAGVINRLPLGGQIQFGAIVVDGRETPIDTSWRSIGGDYFPALRIPLRAGRGFDDRVTSASPAVGVVDERIASALGVDPARLIGRRFRMDFDGAPWVEIAGVAGHVRDEGLDRDGRPLVYWPYAQRTQDRLAMVVRGTRDPRALVEPVRAAIHEIDPNQPLHDVRPMAEVVDRSLDRYRLNAVLTGGFGAVALTLAGAGLFGLLASLADRRRREFGVRLALGATSGQLARIVVREGMSRTAVGLAIGLGVAASAAGTVRALLFDVAPLEPRAFLVAGAVLVSVAAAACLVPAWRAARVDPTTSLRAE
jgi:putative ABC transport system permease protein